MELGVDVERHALLDGVVVARDVLDRGVEVVALGLGEEADVAEVDAEQGHVDAAGELGASQDGAVTAEHHDEVAPLRDLLLGRRDVHAGAVLEVEGLGLVGLQRHVDAEVGEALDDALGDGQRLGASRVGHEQDPARHGAPSRSTASSMSSTAVTDAPGTGLGASQKRNSRLPSPPAIGLAVAPCRCRPCSATTAATSRRTRRRSCGERHDAGAAEPLPADLELRFDQHDQVTVVGDEGAHGGQGDGEGDEAEVGDHEVEGATECLPRPRPGCWCRAGHAPAGRWRSTGRAGRGRRRVP